MEIRRQNERRKKSRCTRKMQVLWRRGPGKLRGATTNSNPWSIKTNLEDKVQKMRKGTKIMSLCNKEKCNGCKMETLCKEIDERMNKPERDEKWYKENEIIGIENFPQEVADIIKLRRYNEPCIVPHVGKSKVVDKAAEMLKDILNGKRKEPSSMFNLSDMVERCKEPYEVDEIKMVKVDNKYFVAITYICKICNVGETRMLKIHDTQGILQLVKDEIL